MQQKLKINVNNKEQTTENVDNPKSTRFGSELTTDPTPKEINSLSKIASVEKNEKSLSLQENNSTEKCESFPTEIPTRVTRSLDIVTSKTSNIQSTVQMTVTTVKPKFSKKSTVSTVFTKPTTVPTRNSKSSNTTTMKPRLTPWWMRATTRPPTRYPRYVVRSTRDLPTTTPYYRSYYDNYYDYRLGRRYYRLENIVTTVSETTTSTTRPSPSVFQTTEQSATTLDLKTESIMSMLFEKEENHIGSGMEMVIGLFLGK